MIVPPVDGNNVTTQCALTPLKGLRSTAIVEVPEIVRAPLVVKVPVTLGNVEKSYTPVMVTGTGVGVEADAESTEPIAKQPSTTRTVANVMFNFFIFNFPFCLLFWPSL